MRRAVTAAGFGLGLATLGTFWAMLVWPEGPVFALGAAAGLLGWPAAAAAGGRSRESGRSVRTPSRAILREPLAPVLIAGIAVCCAGILFNAVYWPFEIGDALALYAPFARHIAETGTLPVGEGLHETYPMLVPIAYALAYRAAGAVSEWLPRLVAALLAIGTIGAGGILARDMSRRGAGVVAAALIAFTPVFGRWASTGYTDIPAAFYVGLTAIFAWRWWTSGTRGALVCTGIAAGLAMWTKNSTLALLPSLVWLVLSRPTMADGHGARTRGPWVDLATVLGVTAAVAGPWYIRNLSLHGFVVPPTAFTDLARHTIGAAGVMLAPDRHFGISGWIFTAAIPFAVVRAVRRGCQRDAAYVLLVLLTPYAAAWWWLASYDARFLMTVVPLLAAMGALMLTDAAAWIAAGSAPGRLRVATIAALAVSLYATAAAFRKSVEHKAVLARTPLMTNADRHRVRIGGLYDLAAALNRLPAGSRVGGVPPMARFHLDRRRFAGLDYREPDESPSALSEAFDYVVYHRRAGEALDPAPAVAPLWRTTDGYALYATGAAVHRPEQEGIQPP